MNISKYEKETKVKLLNFVLRTGPRDSFAASGAMISADPPVTVSVESPAAESQSEESDSCEVALVPHILDVVPYPLKHKGAAHEEGLISRKREK